MSDRSDVPFSLAPVDPATVGLRADRLDAIGTVLRREIDAGRLPGAVGIVARRGRVAWYESFGRLDPARDVPMGRDAIFRIFSMTKPIVSLAILMLAEEGRLLIADPVEKWLPAFKGQKVGVERDGRLELVPVARPATIQDLLRHTSGLTYEFTGTGAVHKLYVEAKFGARSRTLSDEIDALARLPLLCQPGTRWEYSRSTDVLGRIVEVVSGESLGAFLARRIFAPLGMTDTGFALPEAAHARIAEPFAVDPDTGAAVALFDPRRAPALESGGGGLMSSTADYARFMAMLAGGGTLDGVRLLGRKTLSWMTADHLGTIPCSSDLLPPGNGFGLGFAVRTGDGVAAVPGSAGQFYWGGIAGTSFWVDPAEDVWAALMVQAPGQREYYRPLFRQLVHAALA